MFVDFLNVVFVLLLVTKLARSGRQVTVHCGADAENTAVSRIELKTSQLKFQADQNRHVLARIESKLNGMGSVCAGGAHGATIHNPASNCDEIHHNGNLHDGSYYIFVGGKRIQVYCQFDKIGGLNYMVFQRRYSGNQDFYKNWAEYKVGFGNTAGDFWLGLENLHVITKSRAHQLYIEMEDWLGHKAVATYSSFSVDDESTNYRLHVAGYSGTAGDSLSYHDNRPFSTKDRDNDATIAGSCAVQYHGGWWYVGCHHSNLNGFYYKGGQCTPRGVSWKSWKNKHYSLKRVEMKIRPTNSVSLHPHVHGHAHVYTHPTAHYHYAQAHAHVYPNSHPTPSYEQLFYHPDPHPRHPPHW